MGASRHFAFEQHVARDRHLDREQGGRAAFAPPGSHPQADAHAWSSGSRLDGSRFRCCRRPFLRERFAGSETRQNERDRDEQRRA